MQEIEPPPSTTLRPLSVFASLFVLPSVPSVPLSLFRPPIYVSSYLVPPIPATHSLSSFLVSPGYTSPGRGYSVLSVTHARVHTHPHILRHRYTNVPVKFMCGYTATRARRSTLYVFRGCATVVDSWFMQKCTLPGYM